MPRKPSRRVAYEPQPVPTQLWEELDRMRRDPRAFTVVATLPCSECDGAMNNVEIHSQGVRAGKWCPNDGWNDFDSVKFPPTERLTAHEKRTQKEQQ